MTAPSTAVGASLLAHGLHYAMVLAGLWGLAALLLPHALDRLATTAGSTRSTSTHDVRVAALRAAARDGSPGIPVATLTEQRITPGAPALPAWSLPLALVATAAAAGIHAAVVPPHLGEPAAGAFLLAAAVAQLAWAVTAQRPTTRLLRTGVALNLGLVAVWLLSRTVGLPLAGPLGLGSPTHAVGPWDLTCVVWELLAAAACWRVLRRHGDDLPSRCPGWFDWHPTSRAAVGAAVVSLVLLTLAGAHS